VLLVWGTDDVFFPLHWAQQLRAMLSNAFDLVEVPGGRLFLPDERADELASHLRRFWGRSPLPAPSKEPAIS
jgi:pimeloyl-ACP methyl ester carboxylesterase